MKNLIGLLVISLTLTISAQAQSPKGTSLVIVDPELPSLNVLLSQIHPAAKVVYLDKTGNPLTSISRILKANAPVSALHIFSEGDAGTLKFTSMAVNDATLNDHASLLENWRDYFTPRGDILL